MSTEPGIDAGRFGRTLLLIGFVTAVFLILSANRLDGALFRISAVGLGVIALITAMVGFFIAAGSTFDS